MKRPLQIYDTHACDTRVRRSNQFMRFRTFCKRGIYTFLLLGSVFSIVFKLGNVVLAPQADAQSMVTSLPVISRVELVLLEGATANAMKYGSKFGFKLYDQNNSPIQPSYIINGETVVSTLFWKVLTSSMEFGCDGFSQFGGETVGTDGYYPTVYLGSKTNLVIANSATEYGAGGYPVALAGCPGIDIFLDAITLNGTIVKTDRSVSVLGTPVKDLHQYLFTIAASPPSTAFTVGDSVATIASVNVRTSPSIYLAGGLVGTLPSGSNGQVIGGPVQAESHWWWQINFEITTIDGWVYEEHLSKMNGSTDSCQNPSPMPQGFASPCPVFSASPSPVSSGGSLTLRIIPPVSPATYVFKTIYISDTAWNCPNKIANAWCPFTLSGTLDPQSSFYLVKNTGSTTVIPSQTLQTFTKETHYLAQWEWHWDPQANGGQGCYKGPGLDTCDTGAYRVQVVAVQ